MKKRILFLSLLFVVPATHGMDCLKDCDPGLLVANRLHKQGDTLSLECPAGRVICAWNVCGQMSFHKVLKGHYSFTEYNQRPSSFSDKGSIADQICNDCYKNDNDRMGWRWKFLKPFSSYLAGWQWLESDGKKVKYYYAGNENKFFCEKALLLLKEKKKKKD